MQRVTLIGATGVIGTLTLDVIRLHREKFSLYALTARTPNDKLLDLCIEFGPNYVVIEKQSDVADFESRLRREKVATSVLAGELALEEICGSREADIVVTGVVGAAGLKPTVAAIRAGIRVMVANKEPIVMLGPLVRKEVKASGATVLPVDSEHNAIFQCCASSSGTYLPFNPIPGLRRILLTGSGGPFRTLPLDQFSDITPEQAVAHPVWTMGAKISVDSATMMNKGLEIIEARWLFDPSPDQIEVIIHPQGVVHSMVEYEDGSVVAEMATPDMRVPIANALFWPDRADGGAEALDVANLPSLQFLPPDWERFPCLAIARDVSYLDGTSSVVLNAANEVAVDSFLRHAARFTDIADTVRHCVEGTPDEPVESLEQILQVDLETRRIASDFIASRRD